MTWFHPSMAERTIKCLDKEIDGLRELNDRLQKELLDARRLSFDWMKKHDQLLGFIQKRPAVLKELIEEDALTPHQQTGDAK